MTLPKSLRLSVILITLVVTGCDTSQFPISEPGDAPINKDFLGSWTSSDHDEGDTYRLDLFAFNRHEYFGYLTSTDEGEEDLVLRAFESEVNGELLANVQCFACEDDDERGFLFVRLRVQNDRLIVSFVDDDIFDELDEAEGTHDVLSYMEKHLGDEGFFDAETWNWDRMN